MAYKQGIPTEPGLYWYREPLESEAVLMEVHAYNLPTSTAIQLEDRPQYHDWELEGYFCPAIPPDEITELMYKTLIACDEYLEHCEQDPELEVTDTATLLVLRDNIREIRKPHE